MSTDNYNNGKFLPSTNPNSGANSTEDDVWSHAPRGTSATPAYASAADAAAARAERERMVEAARVQGEMQAKRPQLPNMGRNIFDMVPEEHRGSLAEARAYLDQMTGRADAGTPRNLDSSKIGALPIDRAILSNIRSPYGAPRSTSNATDGDIVEYMGVRMEIGEAINQGLLERDANGRLLIPDANARDAAEQQKAAQQNAEAATELKAAQARGDEPDAQTIEAVEMINGIVTPQATQAFIKDFVDNNGTVSLENVHAVAKSVGMSTSTAETMVEAVVRGLTRQADTLALNAGIAQHEIADAWAWAQHVDATEHAVAVRAFIGGDTRGLRRLLAQYKGRNNGR